MERKEKLITGEVYHVFNKSIAGFEIFNNENEFLKMKNIMRFYQVKKTRPVRFSQFMELKGIEEEGFSKYFFPFMQEKEKFVQIIAYCFMPTHIHFILRQLMDGGVSCFMGNILNCYTKHFNLKHKRKGPLWESKFKNVLVDTDEYLTHLSRYVHLNAATANLVKNPDDWVHSSYQEYLGKANMYEQVCDFQNIINIDIKDYKKFAEDGISYQRDLEKIKHLMLN